MAEQVLLERHGAVLVISINRPERRNAVKVLLFLDVGGSMAPHIKVVEELFSAARSEFKHMESFYFHNCLYEGVWRDNRRRWDAQTPTHEIIRTWLFSSVVRAHLEELERALATMGSADPFGFRKGAEEDAKRLVSNATARRDATAKEAIAERAKVLKQRGPGAVWAYMAFVAIGRNKDPMPSAKDAGLVRLTDIYPQVSLDAINAEPVLKKHESTLKQICEDFIATGTY